MAKAGALATLDDSAVLDRIANGEMPTHIAAELNVSKAALSIRYKGNPAYREARKIGAEVRLDLAEQDVREANDALNLARARETFKTVAWRCEREFPEEWGAKQQITVSGQIVHVDQMLAEKAGLLIEQVADEEAQS